MRVALSAWKERDTCTWCEREKECVTAAFADGFLDSVPLCWKCLQKAVKVRSRQGSPEVSRIAASDATRPRKPAVDKCREPNSDSCDQSDSSAAH